MSPRAQSLAEQFERTNAEFISFVARLSDHEWHLVCPNEERTVAALAYHVAAAYPFELRSFKGIADDQALPIVTKAFIDRVNAEDGALRADCDRDEVLELLAKNGTAASEWVRDLSDEELARVGAYLDWVPPMSVDQWIEHVLIGHIRGHLASMQAVVEEHRIARSG